jgi:hypothetical protein
LQGTSLTQELLTSSQGGKAVFQAYGTPVKNVWKPELPYVVRNGYSLIIWPRKLRHSRTSVPSKCSRDTLQATAQFRAVTSPFGGQIMAGKGGSKSGGKSGDKGGSKSGGKTGGKKG